MKFLTKTDLYGYAFLIFALSLGIYTANTNANFYENVYAVEGGPVNLVTAIMFLMTSLLLLFRFINLYEYKGLFWKIGILVFIIISFYKFGEEISWGQSIFGVQSSGYFIEQNTPNNMNIHNLLIDGENANKLIFSQLLTLILIIYLIILPIVYRKNGHIKNLMAKFAVPLVQWHHTIAFLIVTASMYVIPSPKKWEVYELAFGVIFFLIFLNPHNYRIYSKSE